VDPTLAGFILFVQQIMQVPTSALPNNSPFFQLAYDYAIAVTNDLLAGVPSPITSPSIYAQAVYNLGGDQLVNIATDQGGQTYFADLRSKFNINGFVGGVVSSAADEGTSEGMVVPKAAENFTMMNLQQLKTPWGRQYMAIAQSFGSLWGLS
jgi:hypothetical protein